jgi:hypothetical protein
MNLAVPVARAAFTWNHDALMREAAESLAPVRRRAGAAELRAAARATSANRRLAYLLVALLALVVVRWRRRA